MSASESCTDCITTIVTEFPDAFERALSQLGSKPSLTYLSCHNAEPDPCDYCIETCLCYVQGRLEIEMAQHSGGIHVACTLPFAIAADIVADHLPARVGMQFLRLRSNVLGHTLEVEGPVNEVVGDDVSECTADCFGKAWPLIVGKAGEMNHCSCAPSGGFSIADLDAEACNYGESEGGYPISQKGTS